VAIDLSVLCPQIQQGMDEIFVSGSNPELLQEDNGNVYAVTSARNTSAARIEEVATGSGKTRKVNGVQVIVTQRQSESVFDDGVSDCFPENANVPEPIEAQTYKLDMGIETTFEMDLNEWREMCDGGNPGRQLGKYMTQFLNAGVEKVNVVLANSINTNWGNYFGGTVNSGTNPVALDLLQGTPAALNAEGLFDMENGMSDIGAPRFLTVGAGDYRKALQFLDIGCCNDGGADLSQIGANEFYLDKRAQTIWGGQNFLAFAPGAIIMPNAAMNVGQFSLDNTLHMITTMQHPQSGLIFDVDIKLDADCRKTKIWISKRFTIVYPMTGAFRSGDTMLGVNGVIKWNAAT
jgi:hypothetical protein